MYYFSMLPTWSEMALSDRVGAVRLIIMAVLLLLCFFAELAECCSCCCRDKPYTLVASHPRWTHSHDISRLVSMFESHSANEYRTFQPDPSFEQPDRQQRCTD